MTHTLPPGWEEKTLGEVCSILSGLWSGKKEPFCEARVLRNTNFTKDCKLDFSDVACLKVEQRQFSSRELKQGDLLLEKSGGGPKQPVGRIVLFDKDEKGFSFSNFTSVLRVKDKKHMTPHFLHWFLYFCYLSGVTISMQKHTTGIRNLQMNEYKNIVIPIPSLLEQKRIVEKLDKIFAAIDKAKSQTEKNLQNAKALFNIYLNSLSYSTKKLGELVRITTGKLNANAQEKNGKYPFFTCSREILYINTYAFDCEAILLAGNNASADFNVKYYKGKFNAYQRTYVITIQDTYKLSYKYLYFQLIKELSQLKKIAVGANTRFLRLGMIKDINLALPPLEKQQQIVSCLDSLYAKTQELEKIYIQKLADLEELKQSVLQQAFSGKL